MALLVRVIFLFHLFARATCSDTSESISLLQSRATYLTKSVSSSKSKPWPVPNFKRHIAPISAPDTTTTTTMSTKKVKEMMAKKMGMNCNEMVNSYDPLWLGPTRGSVASGVSGECETIGDSIPDETEKKCQGMCIDDCNAFEFLGKPGKPGKCQLYKCDLDNVLSLRVKSNTSGAEDDAHTGRTYYTKFESPNKKTLDGFTEISGWFWTYGLVPEAPSLKWAQKYNKEFVGLINLKQPIPKANGSCTLQELDTENTCTVEQLVAILNETKQQVKMKHLMGYNEPYAGESADTAGQGGAKAHKHFTPEMGAEVWRRIVQPTAEQLGLSLVSPTTGISAQKASWLLGFLQACYDKRDEEEFPCDVKKIPTWSIHEYKCFGSYWRKYASPDGGEDVVSGDPDNCGPLRVEDSTNVYTRAKDTMLEKYGEEEFQEFWEPYLSGVKLWVTETSCGGATKYNKTSKKEGNTAAPPSTTQCKYITGQSCHRQEGSIRAMLGMENIERFSWFTLLPHPPPDHINYVAITNGAVMNYTTGLPSPIGRALLSGLDADIAKCNHYDLEAEEVVKKKKKKDKKKKKSWFPWR